MTGLFEALAAYAASAMMAMSPVTGSCEGRVVSLCDGSGTVHSVMIWDDEGSFPESQGGTKACHACLAEKRKARPGEPEDDRDEV